MPRFHSHVSRLAFTLAVSLGAALAATTRAEAGEVQCASVKTKLECGKKAGCTWHGKACTNKAAKPAAKAAKPAASAPKAEEKKPAPAAEPPLNDEIPAGDGEAEDF